MRVGFTHTDKGLQSQPLRDANSNEFSADYYYFINGLNNFFILGARYKNENALDPQFSYDGVQIRGAVEYRFELLSLPTKARLDMRIRQRDYDKALNEQIDEYRQDTRKRVALSLESDVYLGLSLSLEAAYVENDSDLVNLQYHESLLSLGLKYQF